MSEEQKYPVGMSAGGDNMHYVDCPELGQKKAYAACLHIKTMYDGSGGEEGGIYSDCFLAISRGRCPAVDMRVQEIEAKEALFYQPRPKSEVTVVKIDKASASYARGWNQVQVAKPKYPDLPMPARKPAISTPVRKAAPVRSAPAPKKEEGILEMDYSKVINDMTSDKPKEESTPVATPAPAKAAATSPAPVGGRSLLDIARKMSR